MKVATPEKRPHNRDIEALCAAKGMRMTGQRRTIARVLAESDDHPDVEELYRRCSKVDQQISISTVYRTVKLFEDAGIIERHDFRDGRARYEQSPDTHHDHLINDWRIPVHFGDTTATIEGTLAYHPGGRLGTYLTYGVIGLAALAILALQIVILRRRRATPTAPAG